MSDQTMDVKSKQSQNGASKRLLALAGFGAVLVSAGCSEDRATHSTAGQSARDATAAEQVAALEEVTLSVPGMNCPMCPITVRRALINVDGVAGADASLKTREAHVRFDPALADVDQLMAALKRSGFSATLKEPLNNSAWARPEWVSPEKPHLARRAPWP